MTVTKASDGSLWRSNFGVATFTIEDAGPAAHGGQGRRRPSPLRPAILTHLLEYTFRIHFYAGQSFVRVFYTLENAKAGLPLGQPLGPGQGGLRGLQRRQPAGAHEPRRSGQLHGPGQRRHGPADRHGPGSDLPATSTPAAAPSGTTTTTWTATTSATTNTRAPSAAGG